MECRQAQDEILETLDGRPSVDLLERLGEHLAGCPACAAFLRRQNAIDSRLGQS